MKINVTHNSVSLEWWGESETGLCFVLPGTTLDLITFTNSNTFQKLFSKNSFQLLNKITIFFLISSCENLMYVYKLGQCNTISVSGIILYRRSHECRRLSGLWWSDKPEYSMLYFKAGRTLKTVCASSYVENRTVWWRLRTEWRSDGFPPPSPRWKDTFQRHSDVQISKMTEQLV